MFNRLLNKTFILTNILILLFVGIVSLFVFRIMNTKPRSPEPPITLVAVGEANGIRYLEFFCPNTDTCISKVEIENENLQNLEFLRVGPTYRLEDGSLFISFWAANDLVFWLDPASLESDYFELGTDIDLGSLSLVVDENLILANSRGAVLLLNETGISSKFRIPLQPANFIYQLIPKTNTEFLAINNVPIKQQDKTVAQIFEVNLETRVIDEKFLPLPDFEPLILDTVLAGGKKYNLTIVSVTPDLSTLYYLYYYTEDGQNLKTALAMFDTHTMRDTGNKQDLNCISMAGYLQSEGFLYSNKYDSEGGGAVASLIDMKSLKSLIPTSISDEPSNKFLVAHYGKYFVLGTDRVIIVLDQQGEILSQYDLPENWVNRDYAIVETGRNP